MIRAWLVDDEPLALRRLARMLAETGRVEVAGTSTDPQAAVQDIERASVDAVFLDIEMPGLSGFDLIDRLTSGPAIVFTTAYDRYAVKAFEADGTDYLLKPVSPEALERAISKLERVRGSDPADYREILNRLASAMEKYPSRIASKLGDRVQFVDLGNVTHFFAEGKLTYAATQGKNYVVDQSITQLETRLDPERFLRIHRSFLVNLSCVTEVSSWFGGKLVAKLNDAARTELPVARDRVRGLKEKLGFW